METMGHEFSLVQTIVLLLFVPLMGFLDVFLYFPVSVIVIFAISVEDPVCHVLCSVRMVNDFFALCRMGFVFPYYC